MLKKLPHRTPASLSSGQGEVSTGVSKQIDKLHTKSHWLVWQIVRCTGVLFATSITCSFQIELVSWAWCCRLFKAILIPAILPYMQHILHVCLCSTMCNALACTNLMHWVVCSRPTCFTLGRHIGSGTRCSVAAVGAFEYPKKTSRNSNKVLPS